MATLQLVPDVQNAILGFEGGRQSNAAAMRQNALLAAGKAAAGGDLSGAAAAAFEGGELDAGSRFMQMDLDNQLRESEKLAKLAFTADTPEKMKAAVARAEHLFGPEKARELAIELSQPGGRDRILAEGQALSQLIQNQIAERNAARSQANADRAFSLQERKFGADEAFRKDQLGIQREELDIKRTAAGTKTSGERFTDESNLRKEFSSITKDFRTQRDAAQRVEASGKNPSAAGDLALIFNFMKVLDPGSTVREGEFATAQNAAGIPQRLRAMYNQVINGERLEENQRKDFLTRSEMLFKRAQQQHKVTEDQYRDLAKRNDLNPDNVILDENVIDYTDLL